MRYRVLAVLALLAVAAPADAFVGVFSFGAYRGFGGPFIPVPIGVPFGGFGGGFQQRQRPQQNNVTVINQQAPQQQNTIIRERVIQAPPQTIYRTQYVPVPVQAPQQQMQQQYQPPAGYKLVPIGVEDQQQFQQQPVQQYQQPVQHQQPRYLAPPQPQQQFRPVSMQQQVTAPPKQQFAQGRACST